MKKCPSCGSDNRQGDVKCHSCGALLAGADSTISFPLGNSEPGDIHDIPPVQGSSDLVVAKGPSSGQRYHLEKDEVILGRDPDNDIFLNDVTVSRHHAKIIQQQGRFSLRDSGSLNGTYLNGNRVDEAELRHGDELWIGKYKLIFVRGT